MLLIRHSGLIRWGLRKREIYFCKRPVDGKLGDGLNKYLNHHYICSIDGKGNETCKGLTYADASKNPWPLLPYEGKISGKDRGDYYHPATCTMMKEVKPSCGAELLEKIGSQPAPTFGVAPGLTDCQEWADEVEERIRNSCPTDKEAIRRLCMSYSICQPGPLVTDGSPNHYGIRCMSASARAQCLRDASSFGDE
jgi:hypothetical protein